MKRTLEMFREYEMAQNVALALGCRLPTWAEYVHTLPADEAHAVAVAECDTLHGSLRELRRVVKPMVCEVEEVGAGVGLFVIAAGTWCARRIGLFVPEHDSKLGGD